MPIYEYRCEKCGVFEETRRITDPALDRCPTCRRKVRRLISSTSFQLKGGGWYVTDYARAGKPEAGKPEAGKTDGGKGDGQKGDGDTKDAAKDPGGSSAASATKTESKPAKAETRSTKAETKPATAGA